MVKYKIQMITTSTIKDQNGNNIIFKVLHVLVPDQGYAQIYVPNDNPEFSSALVGDSVELSIQFQAQKFRIAKKLVK